MRAMRKDRNEKKSKKRVGGRGKGEMRKARSGKKKLGQEPRTDEERVKRGYKKRPPPTNERQQ